MTRDAVGAAKQLRELPEQDFRSFVERTLKGMGLVAKGVKASDKAVEFDVIHSASNDHYLVFATKDVEHAKPHDIQKAVERMRKAGVPRGIYLSTGEVSKDAEEYATQFDVAVADAERLGQLLVKFGLDDELDKRSAAAFLEKDGDRKLPSMGQLDSMMSWGYDFFERGNYAKALEYFEKASALKPSYDVPLAMSGKCLSAMGQHEKAVESYEEALRQNPGSEEGWFNLGTALYALGKHEDELACYDKALELNKGYERAWNNKGATLLQLGKDEEAAICFEKALRSNPKNVSALSNRGVALKHLGRLDEALASFDLALSVSSENLDAWLNRGLLLQDMGRNLEAVKSYDRVLTKVRTPEMCAQKASALLAAEVYKAALDSAVAALDMKPGWDVAMELKAAAELGLKKEDESRVPAKKPERLMPPAQRAPEAERERAATVERVEEVTPPAKPERQVQASQAPLFNSLRDFATGESDDAVMFTCSECGSEVGEADNFCIHCGSDLREEAEDDSPSAAEPEEMERIEEARFDAGEELEFEELVGLGEAWMRLRRYEDAIGWFGEALLLKNEARLYRMQGEAAYELGLFDDAIRHFEEALDIDPADIESSWCRADALLRCGRHAVALEAYGSIEAAEGKSARLAIAKARALTAWGRPGKAAEALAEAAAAEGDNSNLWNLAGVAMSSAGRVDDATTCLDKAAQCDPGQWEVWCNRGAVLASRGELELAIKSFDRALAAKPDAGQAIGGKASVLTRQGRADEAVELLDEALSIRQDAGLYATKAFALLESDEPDEAIASAEKGLSVDGGRADLWNVKGIALERKKRVADAIEAFEEALSAHPGFADAAKNLERLGREVAGGQAPAKRQPKPSKVAAKKSAEAPILSEPAPKNAARGGVECRKCGEVNDIGVKRCAACGERLRYKDKEDALTKEMEMAISDDKAASRKKGTKKAKRDRESFVRELMSVPGVGYARANAIWEAGFRSADDIASAEMAELTRIPGVTPGLARKLKKGI